MGFIGFGFAVLGTILTCIPAVFGLGVVVLLAAFVISLIGLFKKGSAKWPSIVGLALSVVGGAIGTVVLVVSLLASVPGPVNLVPTTETPSTGTTESRPSSEEIANGFAAGVRAGGVTEYDDMPDFYPCVGQFLYDSDLSDETLRVIAAGETVTGSERDAVIQVSYDATLACDPNGDGAGMNKGRPSPDELGATILADLQRSGMHQYDDDPEWVACWGQYAYDSDLSDEALQEYVATMDVQGEERELMGSVSSDATVFCSSQ